jgi:hypothetical protein
MQVDTAQHMVLYESIVQGAARSNCQPHHTATLQRLHDNNSSAAGGGCASIALTIAFAQSESMLGVAELAGCWNG